jgi:hypothetical protein
VRSNHNFPRGGHAPGYLRQAFLDWMSFGCVLEELVAVGDDDTPRDISWLIGQLWNCADALPGWACRELDLPAGSSYAQAVRLLHDELEALRRAGLA